MKKLILTSILIALAAAGTTIKGQDRSDNYLGLPGDNLNLFAVMKLFQESKTLEEFERNLNDQNSRINNLDLNGDNMVDYLRVIDNVENNVHYIVMQVAVSERENQDVAVFVVERRNNGDVQIQLIGDEELYGKNYIVEPYYDANGETPNPGYVGNNRVVVERPATVVTTTYYEISAWPIIRFIYLPDYVVWRSRWYWGFYPDYWHSWTPFYWHYYYGYHYHYHSWYYGHYRHWNEYRYPRWHETYYVSRRAVSPVVRERITAGTFKSTYSRPESRRQGEELGRRESRERIGNSQTDNRGIGQERRANPGQKDGKPDNYGTTRRNTVNREQGNTGVNRSEVNTIRTETRKQENTTLRTERNTSPSENRSSVTRKTENRVSPSVSNKSQERRTVTSRSQSQVKSSGSQSRSRTGSTKSSSSESKKSSTEKSGRR